MSRTTGEERSGEVTAGKDDGTAVCVQAVSISKATPSIGRWIAVLYGIPIRWVECMALVYTFMPETASRL
jgi:hypothetical protein